VDFDHAKIVVSDCSQIFKRIKSTTKRHWEELQTSNKEQAEDYCMKSLLKTDQKWGFILVYVYRSNPVDYSYLVKSLYIKLTGTPWTTCNMPSQP